MSYNYRGDPILGVALAYWTRKRGERTMPRKRDIDPTEIPPKLLPNLQIIEVVDAGARFRYRLVGTASVKAYGKDYTGRYADELLTGDRLDFLQKIYRTVYETKLPLFSRNRYHTPKNVDIFAIRVYMPLSEDDVDVHHILGGLRFESGSAIGCSLSDDGTKLDPSGQYFETVAIATA